MVADVDTCNVFRANGDWDSYWQNFRQAIAWREPPLLIAPKQESIRATLKNVSRKDFLRDVLQKLQGKSSLSESCFLQVFMRCFQIQVPNPIIIPLDD